MPVYTLYLSTQITNPLSNNVVPLSKTNLSSCSWRVDWDNLFQNNQYNYKFCRVRFNLISVAFNASVPAGNDWTNYVGYLSTSLPSMYNGTTTVGTILGLINPTVLPLTTVSQNAFILSTMSETGVDIIIPTGVQQLDIQMMNDDSQTMMTAFREYQILLAFELYNE